MSKYLLAFCSILHSLEFDMQHDHFQKNLLTPPWVERMCKSKKFACEFGGFFLGLRFYILVNSYGHVEMVSLPNHSFFLGKPD